MALNDEAVLTAAQGYIFRAPVGTPAPTPAAVKAWRPGQTLPDWEPIGHTSEDELPEFGFDGGETEPRGTWQKRNLKVVQTETISDYMTFQMVQFDEGALELYYGSQNASETAGVYRVRSASTQGIEIALLVIVIDGDHNLGFWAPKVDVRRDDAITLSIEEFGAMPLRANFTSYTDPETSEEILFDWIDEDNINPAPSL